MASIMDTCDLENLVKVQAHQCSDLCDESLLQFKKGSTTERKYAELDKEGAIHCEKSQELPNLEKETDAV